jgi:phosphatidylserine/phosphatidylglycerophosphate/cardiolipin synthase-like enzyme
MANKGSDVNWLVDNGVQARTDNSERFHMHNKFAIVDGIFLVTGSFNWTQ